MAATKKDKPVGGSQAETSTVDQDKTPPEKEGSGLVCMCLNDAPEGYAGPTTADVHSSEVENWKVGGWVVDREQQSEGEHAETTDGSAAAADDASSAAVANGDAANGTASDSNEARG